ncbi:peptidase [Methylobacterium sp. Leaf99]|uniref:A24 family peptidase n=1 Tax=unclassified Methylobacterium TaxID=2615210 RepID=UPI0006F39926|nr:MULTISPECIES: prepilin peptidase [unclassified Methylobacterium]KQP08118.1 peptidase [Methylobacterium sp. Leaf99]TXM66949.1 peptidase [Methylobacterium sp. WL69]
MAAASVLIVFPFLMVYAAVNDLLTMLIPNRITLALVIGFAVVAASFGLGWTEVASHAGAGALVLAITFTLFALGHIGGGDAKLAAGTALWIGFDHLLDYLTLAALAGGILTLAILALRAQPLPMFIGPALPRLPFLLHLHDTRTGVPYGIALAFAAVLVLPETAIWSRALSL